MPCYKVKNNETGKVRLVLADTSKQALMHVCSPVYAIQALSGADVGEYVAGGMSVEDARKPQKDLPLDPPPPNTGSTAEGSTTTFIVDGQERQMFSHKQGCSADPWTPIGQRDCRCTRLEIPPV